MQLPEFASTLWFELNDGTLVYPRRVRDPETKTFHFKVCPAHDRAKEMKIDDETQMRELVLRQNFSVRCGTKNKTRRGHYAVNCEHVAKVHERNQ